jgi:6-phosphogluconate dehydrogenase
MGQNLILNAADHGFTVIAFNRTVSKVDRFLNDEAKGTQLLLERQAQLSMSKANPLSVHTRSRSSARSLRGPEK